jgi:hypothetical protein
VEDWAEEKEAAKEVAEGAGSGVVAGWGEEVVDSAAAAEGCSYTDSQCRSPYTHPTQTRRTCSACTRRQTYMFPCPTSLRRSTSPRTLTHSRAPRD